MIWLLGKLVLVSCVFGTNCLSLASILASSVSSSRKRKRVKPRSGPPLQVLLKRKPNNRKRKRRSRLHSRRNRKRKRKRYLALLHRDLMAFVNRDPFRRPARKQRSTRLLLQMLRRKLGGSNALRTRVGMWHD